MATLAPSANVACNITCKTAVQTADQAAGRDAGKRHTTCPGFVDVDQTSLTFWNISEARPGPGRSGNHWESSGSSRPGLGGQSDLRAIACVTLASRLRPATGRPPLTARDGRWIAFWGAHNTAINFLVCYLAVTTQENDLRLASVL